MTEDERELATVLVEALQLEDKDPATIDPQQALFGEYDKSWGLDSIDALEIALAVRQKYGVEMRAEDDETRSAFASLHALSAYIATHRAH
ncbi:MAG TPA: phosphopantetheine-binding protein [Nevskiaceae bacterium]